MRKRQGKKHRVLLVDGDIVLYQQAFINQKKIDWGEGVVSEYTTPEKATSGINDYIFWLRKLLHADQALVMVTGGRNWRKELFPDYKANRKDTAKPLLYHHCVEALNAHQDVISEARLEADDLMGIYATDKKLCKGSDKIICSLDKDMRTIPAQIFNPHVGEVMRYSPAQAEQWFYQQVLQGDPIDGYYGVPKIGKVKAEKIVLAALADGTPMWDAVCHTYLSAGLTTVEALRNARLAYILRAGDYNFKTQEVRMWTPTKS